MEQLGSAQYWTDRSMAPLQLPTQPAAEQKIKLEDGCEGWWLSRRGEELLCVSDKTSDYQPAFTSLHAGSSLLSTTSATDYTSLQLTMAERQSVIEQPSSLLDAKTEFSLLTSEWMKEYID